jgi:PAS domain S-box-containing protein
MKSAAEKRNRSEAALRESEERLRLTNEAAGIGTFLVDLSTGVAEYSHELAAMLGFPAVRRALVEDAMARVHRDDAPRVRAQYFAALDPAGDGRLRMEFRFVRPGGECRWMTWNGKVEFAQSAQGRVATRILGACVDITQRKLTEEALRESEERFRTIFATAQDAIWAVGRDGRTMLANPRLALLLGTSPEAMIGHPVVEFCMPEDVEVARARIAANIEGRAEEFEFRFRRLDGNPVPVLAATAPLKGPNGAIIGSLGSFRDISERKAAEEHARLLMREAVHRAKNTLSVVQAIARHTIASTPDDFLDRFESRIESLSANQDLLILNDWRGVEIEKLIATQLTYVSDLIGNRITLDGPPVMLTTTAAQGIGMALHELATNAGKYGALSNSEGRVAIAWRCAAGQFSIDWTERAGPPVAPPARRGFGHTVVVAMAKASVRGEVSLDYAPEGLTWHLTCAQENVLPSA